MPHDRGLFLLAALARLVAQRPGDACRRSQVVPGVYWGAERPVESVLRPREGSPDRFWPEVGGSSFC